MNDEMSHWIWSIALASMILALVFLPWALGLIDMALTIFNWIW